MMGTQREMPGVRSGFQSLTHEICVAIFHLTTAGVQNGCASGKGGQDVATILYHQAASFTRENRAALFC